MTVSLSLVDGVGSLGIPVSWRSQDQIQERRELQRERERERGNSGELQKVLLESSAEC